MENFREICEIFSRGDAVIMVRDEAELAGRLSEWAANPSPFAEMGIRAKDLLETLRGSSRRNAALVARELSRRVGAAF